MYITPLCKGEPKRTQSPRGGPWQGRITPRYRTARMARGVTCGPLFMAARREPLPERLDKAFTPPWALAWGGRSLRKKSGSFASWTAWVGGEDVFVQEQRGRFALGGLRAQVRRTAKPIGARARRPEWVKEGVYRAPWDSSGPNGPPGGCTNGSLSICGLKLACKSAWCPAWRGPASAE